jgi:uncharacterized protein (DUF302 family)
MKYIVTSSKSVDQASEDLQQAVTDHKFGVLHIHDIKETLNKKGVKFDNECRIFEVCNPHKAKQVLTNDMSLNMALPCRISVYEENGETKIGMIKPAALLASLSDSEELKAVADEVEEISIQIINQTK